MASTMEGVIVRRTMTVWKGRGQESLWVTKIMPLQAPCEGNKQVKLMVMNATKYYSSSCVEPQLPAKDCDSIR